MIYPPVYAIGQFIIWRALWALLVGYVSMAPAVVSGEMYRWVDEQGRVHLTDTPPPSKGPLQELKVYRPCAPNQAPESCRGLIVAPGSIKMTPTRPGGTVVI